MINVQLPFAAYLISNGFGIAVLTVLVLSSVNRASFQTMDDRLYWLALFTTMVILVIDTLVWEFDGLHAPNARTVNLILNCLYYLLQPIPCLIWCLYVDYKLYQSDAHVKRSAFYLTIPVVISSILSILSIWFDLYFTISANNIYSRSRLGSVMFILCLLFFIHASMQLIVNRKRLDRRNLCTLLIYVAPPIVATILQFIFYGLAVIWISSVLSLLIVYINIQNNELIIDYTTKLYNRRSLEAYLASEMIKVANLNKLLVVMLDVDSFKDINDTYGHNEGDNALSAVAELLLACFDSKSFICRYAGDEFVVVLKVPEGKSPHDVIEDFRVKSYRYSANLELPYKLDFSIGYELFTTKIISVHNIIGNADKNMYLDKAHKLNHEIMAH
ncbi:MAG: GGDEF domain-containing protein [Clostridia bacterium]|nr:GGDEF domain-containing protein [Clostridia bacterium]